MMFTLPWENRKFHLETLIADINRRLVLIAYFFLGLFVLLPIFVPIYTVYWIRVYLVWLFVKFRWRFVGGVNAYVASGMDTLWTCDLPGVNYAINTVLFLDGEPDVPKIKRLIKQQLRHSALFKFRQCLVEVWGVCVWKEVDNFSVHDQVIVEKDETLATQAQLQKTLAELSARPFAKHRPPWQVVVLPFEEPLALTPAGQRQFCVVFRADHTLADGLALVYLLMNYVMDGPAVVHVPPAPPQSTRQQTFDKIWRLVHAFCVSPYEIKQLITRTERNALFGKQLTQDKVVRWSRPIPLATFKSIRRVTQATINDIYLSCLSGALRRHLLTAGSPFPQPVTAIIPISLNTSPDNISCENNISVAHVTLPVDVGDGRDRLQTTSRLMEECKRSPELLVNVWLFRCLVNSLPLPASRRIFRESPATLVSSTVPGPPAPISVWGYNINSMRYFSPHRGRTGVTACFMTYAGQATLTVYADAALVDSEEDIERIVARFNEEVGQLAALADKCETK